VTERRRKSAKLEARGSFMAADGYKETSSRMSRSRDEADRSASRRGADDCR
jgi:hypothetical protein